MLWIILLFSANQASGADALVEAARAGDGTVVYRLLSEGASANAPSSDGTTPLHWAAYREDPEMAQMLLAYGAAPRAVNAYGSTPLAEAAANGNAKVVRLLLEAGVEADERGVDGQTPLMLVARTGRLDAARLLLEYGADVNATESWRGQTALMWAAARREPEMARLLVEYGAEVNRRAAVNAWPRQVSAEPRALYRLSGGLTAMHYAAREGCHGCVIQLISAGADIDLPDPDGITPLYMAIDNLHFDVALALLESGADPNAWDWWGRTPLFAAVDMSTLPRGGRADRPSTDTVTALLIVERLLELGANPNSRLKRQMRYRSPSFDRGGDVILTTGATPLLRAAMAHDLEAVELLLRHGALVDLPNVAGVTPLMAAAGMGGSLRDSRSRLSDVRAQQRAKSTIAVLMRSGADLNARVRSEQPLSGRVVRASAMSEREGQSAVFSAAIWGWKRVVEYLIESGADPTLEDDRGRTVLEFLHAVTNAPASDAELAEVVRYLERFWRSTTVGGVSSAPVERIQ